PDAAWADRSRAAGRTRMRKHQSVVGDYSNIAPRPSSGRYVHETEKTSQSAVWVPSRARVWPMREVTESAIPRASPMQQTSEASGPKYLPDPLMVMLSSSGLSSAPSTVSSEHVA